MCSSTRFFGIFLFFITSSCACAEQSKNSVASCCASAARQKKVTVADIQKQVVEELLPLLDVSGSGGRTMCVPVSDFVSLINVASAPQAAAASHDFVRTQHQIHTQCRQVGSMLSYLYLSGGSYNPQKTKWTRLPPYLKYLKNKLTNLDLSNNAFTDEEDFCVLSRMKNLHRLCINAGCAEGATKIKKVPNLDRTQLVEFEAEHNALTLKMVVNSLGSRFSKLQSLYLSDTQVTDDELVLLKWAPNVETLKLDHLGLTTLPEKFARYKKCLKFFSLNENQFTAEGLAQLNKLRSLERLMLRDNNLTNMPSLAGLENLTFLALAGNGYDGNGFTGDVRRQIQEDLKEAPKNLLIEWEKKS